MSDLLQSAIELKQAQVDAERPRFKGSPLYLQQTFFQCADHCAKRRLPYAERVALAKELRALAKQVLQHSSCHDGVVPESDSRQNALRRYEEAIGLFWFMDPRTDDWRRRGIRDDDICWIDDVSEVVAQGSSRSSAFLEESSAAIEEQRCTAAELLSQVLCNYAMVCKQIDALAEVATLALHDAVRLCPSSLRATFLHAKHTREQSGMASTELREALRLLRDTLQRSKGGSCTGKVNAHHVADAEALCAAIDDELHRCDTTQRRMGGALLSPPNSAASVEPVRPPAPSLFPSSVAQLPATTGLLSGSWFDQARQCQGVIDRLRANRIDLARADDLERQLRDAACDKFFAEYMRPRQLFATGDALTRWLDDDGATFSRALFGDDAAFRDAAVQQRLSVLIQKHFVEEEPLRNMNVLEVELELFSRRCIDTCRFSESDAASKAHEMFVARSARDGPVDATLETAALLGEQGPTAESRVRQMLSRERAAAWM